MNLAQLFVRKLPTSRNNLLCSNTVSKNIIYQKSTKDTSSSSSSSSDSDGINQKKTSSEEAVSKLNNLLKQMVEDDVSKTTNSLNLARPINKRVPKQAEKQRVKNEPMKQVTDAVKNVAESLGGDTKQTESELLVKLLNVSDGNPESTKSLSDIIKGMTIERESKKPQQSKAEQVRQILHQVSSRTKPAEPTNRQRQGKPFVPKVQGKIVAQKIDLFGGEGLGIFTDATTLKESPQLETWNKLQEKELKLAVTHPPANYFQQMVLWTEQGKIWQFPINNEFGLEEEAKVYFADHVFLEDHLEPWCPTKGPIRHFMELVCVGLSKNPYLTVEAKKEHIEWFKNYFEEKKKLLQETGAILIEDKIIKKTKVLDKE